MQDLANKLNVSQIEAQQAKKAYRDIETRLGKCVVADFWRYFTRRRAEAPVTCMNHELLKCQLDGDCTITIDCAADFYEILLLVGKTPCHAHES